MSEHPTSDERVPDAAIDEAIDIVLRAAGSKLAYYTMPGSRERLRIAMLAAVQIIREATP